MTSAISDSNNILRAVKVFAPLPRGVTAPVSVSEQKIQIIILILKRGPCLGGAGHQDRPLLPDCERGQDRRVLRRVDLEQEVPGEHYIVDQQDSLCTDHRLFEMISEKYSITMC